MNGDTARGLAVVAGIIVLVVAMIVAVANGDPQSPVAVGAYIVCLFGVVGIWIFNLVDAPRSAIRWNQRNGYPG